MIRDMELKLTDGKYTAISRGGLESVSGSEELKQRIEMKIRARRGKFTLMPEFGSRLYLLPAVKPRQRKAAAEQYIAEALAGEDRISIENIELLDKGGGIIELSLRLRKAGGSFEINTVV